MIKITHWGDFKRTTDFLNRLLHHEIFSDLDKYGRMGVEALSAATPKESGMAAISWQFRVIGSNKNPGIEWYNTDVTPNGTPIVVLIQYGHATGSGGYVGGRDFINPVMRPIFDQITENVWKKVKA